MIEQSTKVSACVISYNRADLIATVLRGVSFADEVILVDKSSTDATVLVARPYADRIIVTPWSPTVEETRCLAINECRNDWILLLDDDELLTPAVAPWIETELREPRADIYDLLRREYIFGRHDESAYYWPEFHPRLFRRGSMDMSRQVHAGLLPNSPRRLTVPIETGVCIHHLSHKNVAQWIDRANRHTSESNRFCVGDREADLAAYAHATIDRWRGAGQPGHDDYPAAVALARATSDIIDCLKTWEERCLPDGAAEFRRICRRFDAAYAAAGLGQRRSDETAEFSNAEPVATADSAAASEIHRLHTALRDLQSTTQVRIAALETAHAEIATVLSQQATAHAREIAAVRGLAREETQVTTALAETAARLQAQLETLAAQNRDILRSSSWRVTRPLRLAARYAPRRLPGMLRQGRRLATLIGKPWLLPERIRTFSKRIASARAAQSSDGAPGGRGSAVRAWPSAERYQDWIDRYDQLDAADHGVIRRFAARPDVPRLLVMLALPNSAEADVAGVVARLRGQLYRSWRAVLLTESAADVAAAQSAAGGDERIAVVARHEASNAADRAALAPKSDEKLVLVTAAAQLREDALASLAAAMQPGIRLIYADEDRLDASGQRCDPFFKPDFGPELLRHLDYLSGCTLLAGSQQELGAIFAAIVDAGRIEAPLLAFADQLAATEVVHLPRVLHHVAGEVPQRRRAAGIPSPTAAQTSVTIVIPTRNRLELLAPCLASIRAFSTYPRELIEIIVVDNGSDDSATLRYLAAAVAAGDIRVLRDDGPFNYSRLNNAAVAIATGDVLVFLNNDTVIDDPDWLNRLTAYATQPDVGVVGGKLLYPDRTIQHGGMVLGIQGVASHTDVGKAEDDPGYHGLNTATREVAAVTGACLALRRSVFDRIGGFRTELAVAFNDVVLGLDAASRGLRNICIATPLALHFESRSRGFDDTPEKLAVARQEAAIARRLHPSVFRSDPTYNPNLSVNQPYALAFPPRRRKPWGARPAAGGPLRLLLLSITHEVGHGVAVVLDRQAAYLAQRGHEVLIGGPAGVREMPYLGCQRIVMDDPIVAASVAIERDVDCVIAHTPPFFSVVRWLGAGSRTILYDYGEPNPEFFPDAEARRAVLAEKRFCCAMADRVYAISESVRDESAGDVVGVIPLGNAHLAVWDASTHERRRATRRARGWSDRFVILNVCRFHEAERHYKGVDAYAAIRQHCAGLGPALAARSVFVICGKGNDADVAALTAAGLTVCANVSDAEMVDLYAAADAYLNLSRWEGYNLGIGQALAMGLPVIASDIPAHRAFPAFVSDDPGAILARLGEIAAAMPNAEHQRTPIVFGWEAPLRLFAEAVEGLCTGEPEQAPSRSQTSDPADSRQVVSA